MSNIKKVLASLSEFWRSLGDVPNCPMCGGSGTAADSEARRGWTDVVYWQGQPTEVCDQCRGAGKV